MLSTAPRSAVPARMACHSTRTTPRSLLSTASHHAHQGLMDTTTSSAPVPCSHTCSEAVPACLLLTESSSLLPPPIHETPHRYGLADGLPESARPFLQHSPLAHPRLSGRLRFLWSWPVPLLRRCRLRLSRVDDDERCSRFLRRQLRVSLRLR